MKLRFFTFLVSFLTVMSGAVWGQIYKFNYTVTKSGNESVFKIENNDNDNKIIISGSGEYTISGGRSNYQIIVNSCVNATITLKDGVDIDAQLTDSEVGNPNDDKNNIANRCAFEINKDATVTLKWNGNVKLWSGADRAGINVKDDAKLILAGPESGSLEAGSYCNTGNAHTHGAGIGGNSQDSDFGDIVIESGTIIA